MFKRMLICIFTLLSFQNLALAGEKEDELFYNSFADQLFSAKDPELTQVVREEIFNAHERKLQIDVINDFLVRNPRLSHTRVWQRQIAEILRAIPAGSLEPADRIRRERLLIAFGANPKVETEALLKNLADFSPFDIRGAYEFFKFQQAAPMALSQMATLSAIHPEIEALARGTPPPYQPLTKDELRDIFFNTKDAGDPRTRIFMFCSHKRQFPCLMLMRDSSNGPVIAKSGQTLWVHRSLGYAVGGTLFSDSNGYTPSGVYQINGVMPVADKQTSFGKFRRLIVDMIGKTNGQEKALSYLPASQGSKNWWKEASFARDIGRGLLRIHGTGRHNYFSWSSYFPFMPTHGCIAQRENKYGDTTYTDQKLLLDKLIQVQGLPPVPASEEKIKALFIVIEINNNSVPVGYPDLVALGLDQENKNLKKRK